MVLCWQMYIKLWMWCLKKWAKAIERHCKPCLSSHIGANMFIQDTKNRHAGKPQLSAFSILIFNHFIFYSWKPKSNLSSQLYDTQKYTRVLCCRSRSQSNFFFPLLAAGSSISSLLYLLGGFCWVLGRWLKIIVLWPDHPLQQSLPSQ